jgi:phage-related tail fiber protein
MNVTSQRLLSMRSTIKRGLPLVALLVLGACGGSSSSTQDTSSASDTTTAGATVEVSYEEFCSSADANNSKLPQIESTDDAAAITTKINALAAALSDTASKAPAEIKSAADKVAAAAQAMADSLKSDPSLDSFDAVVAKYATPEIDAATESINKLVSEKCGATK